MLIGPVTVFYGGKKLADAIQPALKIFVCPRVRFGHVFQFRSIGPKNADILRRCFWIHYADEAQSEVCAYLGQADTHVPAGRFNNDSIGPYDLGFDSLRDDVVCCSILYATAR